MSIVHDARADVSLPITTAVLSSTLTVAEEPRRREVVSVTDAKVVVPDWRVKSYTVSYKLEGIEDLTDDAYEKRHSKHEYDEKLIKKWDMRRQREEYERKKLLKSRHEASYLQPPRVLNKNKPTAKSEAETTTAVVESLLQRAADLQYIEVLDEALLLDQMKDVASQLKEACHSPPITTVPSRGRRTKEVQENKPPAEKAKASVCGAGAAPLLTNSVDQANDNINSIIKTRKLLKSPVKSYPIISSLWSSNGPESPTKKSSSSSSSSTSPAKKPANGFADHKNCSSGSSIYDDIDLDFRKLENEDTTTTAAGLVGMRTRPTTRSRSSSLSLTSVDHQHQHFGKIECDGGDSSNASSLQAVPSQRKRQRRPPRADDSSSSSFAAAKRSTKRIRLT